MKTIIAGTIIWFFSSIILGVIAALITYAFGGNEFTAGFWAGVMTVPSASFAGWIVSPEKTPKKN